MAEFARNAVPAFPIRTPAEDSARHLPLPHGLYCEGHLTAATIRDNIRRLLAYFSIPESEMVIYLRDERGESQCVG